MLRYHDEDKHGDSPPIRAPNPLRSILKNPRPVSLEDTETFLLPPRVTSFKFRSKSVARDEAKQAAHHGQTERPRSILWETRGPPPSRSSMMYNIAASMASDGRQQQEARERTRIEYEYLLAEQKKREKLQAETERMRAENEIASFKRRLNENLRQADNQETPTRAKGERESREQTENLQRPVEDNYIGNFGDLAAKVAMRPLSTGLSNSSVYMMDEKDISPERGSLKPPLDNRYAYSSTPPKTLNAIQEEPEGTSNFNKEPKAKRDTTTTLDMEPSADPIETKPTCMLNLVCYRSGMQGCELNQIYVANRNRYKLKMDFSKAVRDNPDLITDDRTFFHALRRVYLREMCGIWRRMLFLKTLRGIRLLSVSSP